MATKQIQVQRFSVVSSKSFEDVLAKLNDGMGHTDMVKFRGDLAAAKNYAELEKVIQPVVEKTGLMEFTRYDLGDILRKEQREKAARSLRFIVGNPLIMKQLVEKVPDAGSYTPVTILVDERKDGVHLSYDTMASFLAPYRNAEALKVAGDLDAKVEKLLTTAAG
ncbi:MAG: DUF302 domain-containing protein [Candidatus Acidiferrales bacterium]